MIVLERSGFSEQPNGDLVTVVTIPYEVRARVLDGESIFLAPLPGHVPVIEHDEPVLTAAVPTTQTIEAKGFDIFEMGKMGSAGGLPWHHEAAKHLPMLHKHLPFQSYIMETRPHDAFDAPMVMVNKAIGECFVPGDQAASLDALDRLMGGYEAWCSSHHRTDLWPTAIA